ASDRGRGAAPRARRIQALRGVLSRARAPSRQGDPAGRVRGTAAGQALGPAGSREQAMTYTILGRCPRTGRLGIGIATFSITVGRYCRGVKAMTGVTISQAFANERNNKLALRLL